MIKFDAAKAATVLKGSRAVLQLKKHSPILLTIGGVLGGITSTVLAAKATLKLTDELDWIQAGLEVARDEKPHVTEKQHIQNLAYVYTKGGMSIIKLYGPALAVGVVSIGAIISGHGILQRRNTGLMIAYVGIEKAYEQFKKRVEDTYGAEKAFELEHAIKKEKFVNEDGKEVEVYHVDPDGPSLYARFFDEFSTEYRKDSDYNRVFLQAQQQMANNLLQTRGHVFLNDIYDALGFERTPGGAIVGWVIGPEGKDQYIDFGLLKPGNERFINGVERSVFLDFNVDGIIYNLI